MFTRTQRSTALLYGIACHTAFAAGIGAMAFSLFTGLRWSRGPFNGASAWAANIGLLLSFPIVHSYLLSPRGRRILHHLAPRTIAASLSSTTFALIASLQLAIIFTLWSPSRVVFWQTTGWGRLLIAGAAGIAWLTLLKSMWDAHLALQTGWLGWSAVVRNKLPVHRRFATGGIYRYVRQPIYISFAALLWLAADGTLDQIILASAWSAYCVVGSALKERRFLRCFGEAFQRYQQQVPFWIPRRPQAFVATQVEASVDADVLIAGGGPVGLVLASLLSARGLKVIVAERRRAPPTGSMAIGITPPSLAVLDHLGLAARFTQRGVRIDRAYVHEAGRPVGDVDFSRIPALHRFILSLPQRETLAILEEHVRSQPRITMIRGVECTGFVDEGGQVEARLRDVESDTVSVIRTRFLAACDGHRGLLRECSGIPTRGHAYGCQFMMADFEDETLLGPTAHLFFGADGSVESFPLPGGHRRWIVQLPAHHPVTEVSGQTVAQLVYQRCGHDLRAQHPIAASRFAPVRMLANTYARGRFALCGDAAHVMSPIGGQGMNTGIGDAAHLAAVLADSLLDTDRLRIALHGYTRARKRAFRVASARAVIGMWVGTRRGPLASFVRALALDLILGRPVTRDALAPLFAMLTVPGTRDLPRHLKGLPT